MYKQTYQSEDPNELEKERAKQKSILSLMPLTAGGSVDETDYVLLNDKAHSNKNRNNEVTATNTNKPKQDVNPWFIEKSFDEMQTFKLAKPTGGYHTIKYPRPTYGSQEKFNELNQSKFNSVIGYSFDFEGGYANNKFDKGGETNHGITSIFMEEYKHALPGGKSKPIKELTKEDARLLYKAQWDKYNLGYIRNKELALVLNDYMINSHARNVAKRVQNILNSRGENLKVDGVFGEKTLNAIHNTDEEWLIKQIIIDRYNWYRKQVTNNPEQINHYTGWINRLNKIAEYVGAGLVFPTKF